MNNALMLDQELRHRQREACSQARQARLVRALRAERRARRAVRSASAATERARVRLTVASS